MLEGLAEVSWASLSQPKWNRQDEVPLSLQALAACSSEAASNDAYHRFLYAVGNDHAGIYYPVTLSTIPFLGEILRGGSKFSQKATLNALIDLIGSFCPAPTFEFVEGSGGVQEELKTLLWRRVSALAPDVRAVIESAHGSGAAELARDLMDLIDKGWAT